MITAANRKKSKKDDSELEWWENNSSNDSSNENTESSEANTKKDLGSILCTKCLEKIWNDPQRDFIIENSLDAYKYSDCVECNQKNRKYMRDVEHYRCMCT